MGFDAVDPSGASCNVIVYDGDAIDLLGKCQYLPLAFTLPSHTGEQPHRLRIAWLPYSLLPGTDEFLSCESIWRTSLLSFVDNLLSDGLKATPLSLKATPL